MYARVSAGALAAKRGDGIEGRIWCPSSHRNASKRGIFAAETGLGKLGQKNQQKPIGIEFHAQMRSLEAPSRERVLSSSMTAIARSPRHRLLPFAVPAHSHRRCYR